MYDHYRAFSGIVLNSWELNNKSHLISSVRGQALHAHAGCPSGTILFSPEFDRLSINDIQRVVLACPARYFAFDKVTLRVAEVSKERWLELFRTHPGMTFLP